MSRVVHYIYVIGTDEGPVKIGITCNLIGRLRSLQTGYPRALKLIYAAPAADRDNAREHESMVHGIYADRRLSGEWFDLDAELAIEAIETSFQTEHWFFERQRREQAVTCQ